MYLNALLSCGKPRLASKACPVAFGEINIGKRIRHILRYRKPAVWVCLVAACAIVFVAVFFMTDPMTEYPPYYDQLMSLVGQSRETVVQVLGIELEQTQDSALTGRYATPIRVQYQGAEFDLELSFSVLDDRLWDFRYIATYDQDREQAAEDTVAVAKQLQRIYGEATQNANKRTLYLSRIDVQSVIEKFANQWVEHEGIDEVRGSWDLTDEVTAQTAQYWENLVQTEYWKQQWPNRNVYPVFGLTMSAWNDPDTDITVLYMEFGTSYRFGTVAEYADP